MDANFARWDGDDAISHGTLCIANLAIPYLTQPNHFTPHNRLQAFKN
jgi:hypothetical protein